MLIYLWKLGSNENMSNKLKLIMMSTCLTSRKHQVSLQCYWEAKSFMLLEDITSDLQELNNSKWSTLTPDALFPDMLQDASVLYKNCTIKDLVVIGKVLERYTGRPWYNHKISKAHNVNTIVEAFWFQKTFLQNGIHKKQEKTTHNPKSLYYIMHNFMKENWKPIQLQVSYALVLHKVNIEKWEWNCPTDMNMTDSSIRKYGEYGSHPGNLYSVTQSST